MAEGFKDLINPTPDEHQDHITLSLELVAHYARLVNETKHFRTEAKKLIDLPDYGGSVKTDLPGGTLPPGPTVTRPVASSPREAAEKLASMHQEPKKNRQDLDGLGKAGDELK